MTLLCSFLFHYSFYVFFSSYSLFLNLYLFLFFLLFIFFLFPFLLFPFPLSFIFCKTLPSPVTFFASHSRTSVSIPSLSLEYLEYFSLSSSWRVFSLRFLKKKFSHSWLFFFLLLFEILSSLILDSLSLSHSLTHFSFLLLNAFLSL